MNHFTNKASEAPERLLYIGTLDRIMSVMFPHLDAARQDGWSVEIACQPTLFAGDMAQHADRVHAVPLKRFPLHPMNLIALRQLVQIIVDGEFTIVHTHNPTGGFVGRFAATLANRKLRAQGKPPALRVYTAHGFHFHRHGGKISNLIYRTAETLAGRVWSDAVLTITREDYEAALNQHVVPADCLFLTGGVGVSAQSDFNPARVSSDTTQQIQREVNAGATTPIVTMVGEMIPRKRHADALVAWKTVLQSVPDALLLLVGDGKLDADLRAQARTLGIDGQVRFLGFRRDIAEILSATDVFLFPSGQEGLPCAVQEALSMEVPTVATDVRGNTDLVDADCGRLVTLGDTTGLANAVVELLSLPVSVRQQMGKVGRTKMLARFDRAACVAQWRHIYEQKKAKHRLSRAL